MILAAAWGWTPPGTSPTHASTDRAARVTVRGSKFYQTRQFSRRPRVSCLEISGPSQPHRCLLRSFAGVLCAIWNSLMHSLLALLLPGHFGYDWASMGITESATNKLSLVRTGCTWTASLRCRPGASSQAWNVEISTAAKKLMASCCRSLAGCTACRMSMNSERRRTSCVVYVLSELQQL